MSFLLDKFYSLMQIFVFVPSQKFPFTKQLFYFDIIPFLTMNVNYPVACGHAFILSSQRQMIAIFPASFSPSNIFIICIIGILFIRVNHLKLTQPRIKKFKPCSGPTGKRNPYLKPCRTRPRNIEYAQHPHLVHNRQVFIFKGKTFRPRLNRKFAPSPIVPKMCSRPKQVISHIFGNYFLIAKIVHDNLYWQEKPSAFCNNNLIHFFVIHYYPL